MRCLSDLQVACVLRISEWKKKSSSRYLVTPSSIISFALWSIIYDYVTDDTSDLVGPYTFLSIKETSVGPVPQTVEEKADHELLPGERLLNLALAHPLLV